MEKISSLFHFVLQSLMITLLTGAILTATGVIDFGLKDFWVAKELPTIEKKVVPTDVKVDPKPKTVVETKGEASVEESSVVTNSDPSKASSKTTKSGN